MSDKLTSILDENKTPEDVDAILERALQAKFDRDLRRDLEKNLQQDYHLSKGMKGGNPNTTTRRTLFYFAAAIAAGLALLILALNVFAPFAADPQKLASSYLESSEIYHSGATKGIVADEDTRMEAIRAFNARQYAEAEQLFSRIEEKTEEDLFYGGVASLYRKNYPQAIDGLSAVTKTKSEFQTEASWYLAIAYVLNGEEARAREVLSAIRDTTWNQDKTKKLLKSLK